MLCGRRFVISVLSATMLSCGNRRHSRSLSYASCRPRWEKVSPTGLTYIHLVTPYIQHSHLSPSDPYTRPFGGFPLSSTPSTQVARRFQIFTSFSRTLNIRSCSLTCFSRSSTIVVKSRKRIRYAVHVGSLRYLQFDSRHAFWISTCRWRFETLKILAVMISVSGGRL